MAKRIYEVKASYGSPASANGFFDTAEKAAIAVTKQEGVKRAGAFNATGIAAILKELKIVNDRRGSSNTVVIARTRATVHSLK